MARTKGALGKNVWPLRDKALELGVDPFEVLLLFAKGDWEKLGYRSATKQMMVGDSVVTVDTIETSLRLKAAAESCKYLYPQLRSTDLTTGGESINTFKDLVELAKSKNDGSDRS